MVSNQQNAGNPSLTQFDYALAPLSLVGGVRVAIAVGVTREQHQVHLSLNRRFNDCVERSEKVGYADWQHLANMPPWDRILVLPVADHALRVDRSIDHFGQIVRIGW